MERFTGCAALSLIVVMVLVLGCAGEAPPAETPVVTPSSAGELAALVNGQPIVMEEYEKQVAQVEAFFAQEGLDLESAEGRERLAQARRQVLEQMIDQELIRQAAAAMGVSISESQLESSLQEIIDQSGGQDRFDQSLQAMGNTYDDFRQMLLDQLLSEGVYGAVTASISSTAEQVHARHILVATRERAEEVLARLQAGEDFSYLAREYSEDISSRETGGDVGFFPRGIMPPEVEEVAFSAQVGEVSGVIESQFGFHIIQVLEKEEREIAVEVFENLRQQTFMQWLQQRREGSTIERLAE
ncbi:MAG TPA: peptidylprolyl isomerase [Anaerolineae bacterium]|nr:peptidylprolyl isomerase [Anaerolineae bacterium]